MTRSRRPQQASRRGAPHARLRVAMIALTVLLTVFGARLFQIQGVDAASYAQRAGTSDSNTVVLPAARGRILDRDGEPLAESVAGLMLVADPQTTAPHAEAIAKILAKRLDVDYFDQLELLSKPDTRFVYLARKVPSTTATEVVEELRAKKYAGVDVRTDPLRTYPAGDVAGNLIGFLGNDGSEDSDGNDAMAGLEQTFDSYLSGTDGEETYEVGGGNRIPLGERSKVDPVDGRDLSLTVDRDVQWYSQRVLCTAVQRADATWGAAVVMDTETGELLALADCPSISPTNPGRTPQDSRASRALSDAYEPGSVEKVLTFASLIDADRVTPETRLSVPGELKIYDRTIRDYFDHGLIRLTSAGVIAKSSNIGTTLAAEEIEPELLRSYLVNFGLGSPVNLGLVSEGIGALPSLEEWNKLTQSQVSFGQGLSVNAVQMTAAVNTIANGGLYVSPSLVEGERETNDGRVVGSDTAEVRRVVSAETAEQVARMMELVVDPDEGTAPGAAIPGYRVAGKTGTAQQAGATGYSDGYNVVSFGGFAPADKPRFTVYAVISNPAKGGSGGGTAGPVFRQILNYVLQRYAVPPTGRTQPAYDAEWTGSASVSSRAADRAADREPGGARRGDRGSDR